MSKALDEIWEENKELKKDLQAYKHALREAQFRKSNYIGYSMLAGALVASICFITVMELN